jgi:alpha-ketoglutarate-dependent taurine dioxygenase
MHSAMWQCAVVFDWQAGDVLCIENERCMHGRTSFTGDRRLACGFAAL